MPLPHVKVEIFGAEVADSILYDADRCEQEDMKKIFDTDRWGRNTAIITEAGEHIDYASLAKETAEMAAALQTRTLVFCLCNNTPGSVLFYIACLNAGVVPALLPAGIGVERLTALLYAYHPAGLWIPEDRYGELSCPAGYDQALLRYRGYVLLTDGEATHTPLYPKLALLLTTSGSTGSPRLVRQTYNNIRSNAAAIADYLSIDEQERAITTLPMHYTYGLSVINSHLLKGATILLTRHSVVQKDFWKFAQDAQATSLSGVPYTYEMFRRVDLVSMELPSLKTLTQAGGKLSAELQEFFARYARETGRRFFIMYGGCEATARMAYLPYERALDKIGSIGIAIPGGRITLVDAAGQEITEAGTAGEIVYEGPNVTLGYATCAADLERGDDLNGVLHTGDIAWRDEEGFLTISGRQKRFLKLFGNRVHLDDTEELLRQRFPALDLAVTGRDDRMRVCVAGEGYSDALTDYLTEVTGLNRKAFEVKEMDAIPRTEAGKVCYGQLL